MALRLSLGAQIHQQLVAGRDEAPPVMDSMSPAASIWSMRILADSAIRRQGGVEAAPNGDVVGRAELWRQRRLVRRRGRLQRGGLRRPVRPLTSPGPSAGSLAGGGTAPRHRARH